MEGSADLRETIARQQALLEKLSKDALAPPHIASPGSHTQSFVAGASRSSPFDLPARSPSPILDALKQDLKSGSNVNRTVSPTMLAQSIKNETRVLEMHEIKAEEEAAHRARERVLQLQSLKSQSERKDQIIEELRKQVQELLIYKEKALEMQTHQVFNDQRSRIRAADESRHSEDLVTKVRQYQDLEHTLRNQILQLEEARLQDAQKHSDQVSELESQCSVLRDELEKVQAAKMSLEKDFQAMAKASQAHQMAAADRDDCIASQSDAVNRLQKEVDHLREDNARLAERARNAVHEAEEKIHNVETVQKRASIEAKDLQNALEYCREEMQLLEKVKLDQAATIANLQHQLNESAAESRNLQYEVDRLQSGVDSLPELKSHLETCKENSRKLESALADTKLELETSNQEKLKLTEINSHLEERLTTFLHKYSGATPVAEELAQKRRQVEFLTGEVERYRERASKLRSDMESSRHDMAEELRVFHRSSAGLTSEVNFIQKMMDHVISGNTFPKSEQWDTLTTEVEVGSWQNMLLGLRSRSKALLLEICATRADKKKLDSSVEGLSSDHRRLELDFTNAQQEVKDLKSRLSQTRKTAQDLENEKKRLENPQFENLELKRTSDTQERDMSSRTDFIYSLTRQLLDHSGSGVREERQDRSWTSVQVQISEQVSSLLIRFDSIKRELHDTKARLEQIEAEYSEKVKVLQQEMESERREHQEWRQLTSREHHDVLKALEDEHKRLRDEYDSQVQVLGREMDMLRSQVSDDGSKSKQLQGDLELMSGHLASSREREQNSARLISLLVQFARPAIDRNREILEQKSFLSRANHRIERMVADIGDLADSVGTEFDLGVVPRRSRPTMRVMAILALAANRIRRLKSDTSSVSKMHIVGRQRIYMAPPPSDEERNKLMALAGANDDPAACLAQIVFELAQRPSTDAVGIYRSSQPLVDCLADGLRDQRWKLQQKGENDGPLVQFRLIRSSFLEMSRRLRESVRDSDSKQQTTRSQSDTILRQEEKIRELGQSLVKGQELIAFLEKRVQDLQTDSLKLIPPSRYEVLKKESEEVLHRNSALTNEKLALVANVQLTDRHDAQTTLQQELDHNLTVVSELRRSLQHAEDSLRVASKERDGLKKDLEESKHELENCHTYMKRKAREMVELEEERQKSYQALMEVQNSASSTTQETSQLRSFIRQLESELSESRAVIAKLEQRLLEHRSYEADLNSRFEQRVSEEVARRSNIVLELHSRETSSRVDEELARTKAHSQRLREELEQAQLREIEQQQDRQKWARARLELLNMRSAAENDLDQQIGLNKEGPSGSVADASLSEIQREQEELQSYIRNLDKNLYQGRYI